MKINQQTKINFNYLNSLPDGISPWPQDVTTRHVVILQHLGLGDHLRVPVRQAILFSRLHAETSLFLSGPRISRGSLCRRFLLLFLWLGLRLFLLLCGFGCRVAGRGFPIVPCDRLVLGFKTEKNANGCIDGNLVCLVGLKLSNLFTLCGDVVV